ncbi:conjugal transfer protein TraC [Polymorphobacter multimanifer]|uniref:Conjugal transfer ATP-binding protein TraC n=1 Tax=Polymorphobacter multimanifer TaxID=1070431 RepID=A0A841L9N4_9SPHN|nr:type IV secretion system protein TraC [Polymorphobacter multimanifer]MBB6229357.1 conjugal transfer ATP-binding protein TraC [Polymorphobacter multimanifer]GGI88103.1 conjugal transfer protein TraC [Polymorphobacter multimanifer]
MSWIDNIAAMLTGDTTSPDAPRPSIHLDTLSSWLPYRTYIPEEGLFINAASIGFIMEMPPLVGADERTADILGQFFQEGMPAGAQLQVLSWGSPRVSRRIGDWFVPRYQAGGIYKTIGRHRAQYLSKGVWESLSKDAPFYLRNHRVIISCSVPVGRTTHAEMIAARDGLAGVLQSINVEVAHFKPVDLIELIDDMTSPTTAAEIDVHAYNELDPINEQVVRRDIDITVEEARMLLRTERFRPTSFDPDGVAEVGECYPDNFDIRHFAVRNYPARWTPWESVRLIGDMFSDKLRLPCPTATVLCLMYPDEEAASAKAGMKSVRSQSLAESRGARWMPGIQEKSQEWRDVQVQLKEGRKLVQVFYGVTTFSPLGEGDRNERTVKSIYRSAGWDLNDERFLQIQGLLTALPMTLADGLGVDMQRLKRFRTMLSSTAANLAPMQGEYLGSATPHLLLVGRRGQPFFWSPFENGAGNHNVTIMGKSGSGKSVLLQEVCAALVGAGAKVVVIDDGRSFMNSVKIQGGAFIEFTMASGFCLNPFSMIDQKRVLLEEDYKLDCMAMLKAIVGQMARFIDKLNDTERGLIDGAVNSVWEEHGNAGSVDFVADYLRSIDNADATNLGIAMSPFTSKGTYGRFFVGQATLSLDSDFTVFELSDLSSREELRGVVLTAIMFMTTQMMTRTPRSVKKMLLIDEAWQLLKGGSMADFVEAYARTCRKYGGSLATATQSLNDYYKSEGAQAALENSDWMLILQQKPETIADFKRLGRLEMDAGTETLIRSLKRNGTEYSEVFIKGPETQSLGRLVLDPYSATVFSSSPATFARIEAMVGDGMTIAQAVERIAFPGLEVPHALAAE